jgi:anti-sigma regulatory factor (Ser/Thr protein kinase)
MADELALPFKSTLESMGSALETLSTWLADRGVSEEVCYFANLAVEELATNCMKFGYADSHEHTLEAILRLSESGLLLTFTDDGRPFNPLLLPDPDLDPPIDARPTGGLGLFLLRRLSDRMEYTREEGRNRISLYKVILAKDV